MKCRNTWFGGLEDAALTDSSAKKWLWTVQKGWAFFSAVEYFFQKKKKKYHISQGVPLKTNKQTNNTPKPTNNSEKLLAKAISLWGRAMPVW